MPNKLIYGDYSRSYLKMITVEYIDEILQDVCTIFYTKRGSFYPNKEFGSCLYDYKDANLQDYIAFAREAVNSFDGVFVINAKAEKREIIFNLLINNEEKQVTINIENNL